MTKDINCWPFISDTRFTQVILFLSYLSYVAVKRCKYLVNNILEVGDF